MIKIYNFYAEKIAENCSKLWEIVGKLRKLRKNTDIDPPPNYGILYHSQACMNPLESLP